MTGNPVECVVHPDLWNRTKLWDPLGIGRVSLDLDDEYMEENYGTPVNTVRRTPEEVQRNERENAPNV